MKPMLACPAPNYLNTLRYPVLVSEKLDGIRCVIKDGVALSRTLKPIRNKYIQSVLGKPCYNGLDGELIIGDPTAKDCMRATNSGVMSIEGTPDFKYFVFDIWDRPGINYKNVVQTLESRRSIYSNNPHITILSQRLCYNADTLTAYEDNALSAGYEGLIVRCPNSYYKFGRATQKEGVFYKLKRFTQDEAVVVGYKPLLKNDNDAAINALGYTQRSAAMSGKIEMPLLGALTLKALHDGEIVTFDIGTGFTFNERYDLWLERRSLIGKIVTYKYFSVGIKEKPRQPVFVSFRDIDDL